MTGLDGKRYPAKRPEARPAPKPAAGPKGPPPGLSQVVEQLASLAESLNDGRGFWAAVRGMEDEDRWAVADQLERLSKAMYRRATELRNRAG